MTFNCRSYIDALSAMFNECIARHGLVPQKCSLAPSWRYGARPHKVLLDGVGRLSSYLPASDS